MHEAEGLNFKVGVASEGETRKKSIGKVGGYRYNNPGLQDIIDFIDRLSVTEGDKDRLVKAAKRVPHGALANFRANYMNYLKKGGRG